MKLTITNGLATVHQELISTTKCHKGVLDLHVEMNRYQYRYRYRCRY